MIKVPSRLYYPADYSDKEKRDRRTIDERIQFSVQQRRKHERLRYKQDLEEEQYETDFRGLDD